MSTPTFKKTNITEAEHAQLLVRLDSRDRAGGANPRRASARMEYRVRDIPISVNHPGGGIGRYIVLGRNLSAGGISLLHAGYMHTGTDCRMVLTMAKGGAKTLIGKVVFCRLVAGHIHEIGVQFSQKIDMTDFVDPEGKRVSDDPDARALMDMMRSNALIASASEADRKVLTACLKQSGFNATPVDCAGAALDQVKLLPYTIAVVDLNLPEPGPKMLVKALTDSGYSGCIIGLATTEVPGDYEKAVGMGMGGCILRPVKHEGVHAEVSKVLKAAGVTDDASPITSKLAKERGASDVLEYFVSAARQGAGAISAALPKSDLQSIIKECQTLKSIAGGYGFQSVAEAARQALVSLEGTKSVSDSMGRITALLNLCSRLSVAAPQAEAKSEPGDGAVSKAA